MQQQLTHVENILFSRRTLTGVRNKSFNDKTLIALLITLSIKVSSTNSLCNEIRVKTSISNAQSVELLRV